MTDEDWLRAAIELSYQCPPTDSAFNVGAIVVDEHGTELARGYSRETDAKVHADPRHSDATAFDGNGPPRL